MEDTILLLSDLDKVRERPGMYIGDNDKLGLATIIREIIDNAIDEYPNYVDKTKPIEITVHQDDAISVRDYGRGISPYESKANPGEIEERLAYTRIGAGGKFKANRDHNNNTFSGGLNGTGAAATNAMSSYFDVKIYKDGFIFHDRFEEGEPVIPLQNNHLKIIDKTTQTGTHIHFKPSDKYLQTTKVDIDYIEHYLEQQSYLHDGLRIVFNNEKRETTKIYYQENGLMDYMQKLIKSDDNKVDCLIEPFKISGHVSDTINNFNVQMAMNIVTAIAKDEISDSHCFTNGIYNSQGGTHLQGFYDGLVRLLRDYYIEFKSEIETTYKTKIDLIKKMNQTQEVQKLFTSRMISKRTFVIIDFKHNDPILQPQTKDKLVSKEVVSAISNIYYLNAKRYLDKNITAIQTLLAYLIHEMYQKAKESDANIKISKKDIKLATSKLAAARGRNPKDLEIIIVEGDSAAGTLKANRDANFQAILPLRGKVLNTHRATLTEALNNNEIVTISAALGIDFGKHFDINKLKYHKIIIGVDQDVDGKHIRVLLLTFFMKYAPEVIKKGHVYFLDTPLFVNEFKNGETVYTYSQEEQNQFMKTAKNVVDVSRNKGLGELSKEQCIETILEPSTRKLTQVNISDEENTYQLIDKLMGKDTNARKHMLGL